MDATWNDNNEFDIQDPTAVAVGFGDKAAPAAHIRPALTYLMVLSSYQAQMEMRPAERPFLSTRSAGIGLRRLAQTWSGDNYTSFHDLRYCHYVGMTLSLSGFYFYGHDLGGFSGEMLPRSCCCVGFSTVYLSPALPFIPGTRTAPPPCLGAIRR